MRPLKDKNILPILAKDEEELKLLQNISSFYWKEVRNILTTTSHDNIRIYKLGTFYRKYWLLDKMIEKCERFLQRIKEKNIWINQEKYDSIVSNLQLFKKMKERDEEVKDKEQKDKLRKQQYYESKSNLKEQG